MTRREAVLQAEQKLQAAGIADAAIDARYLFYYAAGIGQTELLLYGKEKVSDKLLYAYDELISKRAEHIPLQYLTGVQEFMGIEFFVTPKVLIPRQDTERLVEEVLKYSSRKRVLDICTGSGCIAVSVAKLGNPAYVAASDLSKEALDIARKNAVNAGVEVEFFCGDLFVPVKGTYEVIVSNPPYIRTSDIEELMPEVRCHEPRIALDGAADGLIFYRRITKEAGKYLANGGFLFLEIGCGQAEAVVYLMQQNGFSGIHVIKDYAGLDRVVWGYKL